MRCSTSLVNLVLPACCIELDEDREPTSAYLDGQIESWYAGHLRRGGARACCGVTHKGIVQGVSRAASSCSGSGFSVRNIIGCGERGLAS